LELGEKKNENKAEVTRKMDLGANLNCNIEISSY
jgi:hypothetical protein